MTKTTIEDLRMLLKAADEQIAELYGYIRTHEPCIFCPKKCATDGAKAMCEQYLEWQDALE